MAPKSHIIAATGGLPPTRHGSLAHDSSCLNDSHGCIRRKAIRSFWESPSSAAVYLSFFSAVLLLRVVLSSPQVNASQLPSLRASAGSQHQYSSVDTTADVDQPLRENLSGHAGLRRLEEGPEYDLAQVPLNEESYEAPPDGPKIPGNSSTFDEENGTDEDSPKITNVTATVISQLMVIILIAFTAFLMVMCLMSVDVPRQFEEKPLQVNKEY